MFFWQNKILLKIVLFWNYPILEHLFWLENNQKFFLLPKIIVVFSSSFSPKSIDKFLFFFFLFYLQSSFLFPCSYHNFFFQHKNVKRKNIFSFSLIIISFSSFSFIFYSVSLFLFHLLFSSWASSHVNRFMCTPWTHRLCRRRYMVCCSSFVFHVWRYFLFFSFMMVMRLKLFCDRNYNGVFLFFLSFLSFFSIVRTKFIISMINPICPKMVFSSF